jgi:hypothetical protein
MLSARRLAVAPNRAARLAAYLLIAALAALAAYFVIVGVPYTTYAEVLPGSGQALGPAQTVYMPYYPALYSPLVLVLVAIGLIRDRWLPLAWVGLLLHLAIGGLLIFSLGILYIGVTGVLVALVSIIEWQATGRARWLLAAAAGAALLLLIGAVMLGTAFAVPLLAAGLLLSGWVLALWTQHRQERQRML